MLFVIFFFLAEQIDAAVYIQHSETVYYGECVAAVGIGVHHCGQAYKVAAVIVDECYARH